MQTRSQATASVRDRILDATLDELAAAGGEAITMQAVAERADVALRTLYNHFPGRDQLLATAFARHAAQTRADIEALTVPDAEPWRQLRHVVAAYHARYARMGTRLGALLALRGFPELDEHIRAVRAWRHALLADIVERGRRDGTLTLPDQTAVALAFTLTSYAGWQTLLETVGDDPEQATRIANQALSSALFHR
jgi:AcrR family transcriptional regulator